MSDSAPRPSENHTIPDPHLTREEAEALRLASIFGGPDKPHDMLESAKRKLRTALSLEVGEAPTRPEIPADYWREVPCGHPPDPIAMYGEHGPVCHCGWGLDPAIALPEIPAEAPGPIVRCEKCGCHVAIPPEPQQPHPEPVGVEEARTPEHLIAAAVDRCRRIETDARDRSKEGLPNAIAHAQGELGAVQEIAELLEGATQPSSPPLQLAGSGDRERLEEEPTTHELKCWPPYFAAILDGQKNFEFRVGDRDYKPGDLLHLREFDPEKGYTGRDLTRRATYVLHGDQFGIRPGFVVMALASRLSPENSSGGEEDAFLGRLTDAAMDEPVVVAALDKFSFDGRGYSVADANRMREALNVAIAQAFERVTQQEEAR